MVDKFIKPNMIIFYGLGNNEDQYLKTKHNIGRLVLEEIAKNLNLFFEKKTDYLFTKIGTESQLYFLISAGYMNHSGIVLHSFCNFYKLDFNDSQDKLIILQDDSDQMENTHKLSVGGGHAGHNGVKDIYKHALGLGLKEENIWRLKIGIRPEQNRNKSETFVLNKIGLSQENYIKKLAELCTELLPVFNKLDIARLQNKLNTLTLS